MVTVDGNSVVSLVLIAEVESSSLGSICNHR